MTSQTLKVGDKVSWSTTQVKVTGSVKKKMTVPMDTKTYPMAESPDNPKLLVKIANSGKVALHKRVFLKKVKAK